MVALRTDAELRWLQGNDDDKHDNDCCDSDEEFFEHGTFSSRPPSATASY